MQITPVGKAERLKKGKNVNQLSFRGAIRLIYLSEGFPGFFRGLAPAVLKSSFMTGQYFSLLFYNE